MKAEREEFPGRLTGIGMIGLAVISVLVLAGCGNLPAGGATGETTVYVVGDGEEPPAAPAASSVSGTPLLTEGAPLLTEGAPRTRSVADLTDASAAAVSAEEPEGEIELEFDLELVRPDGTTVPLTDQEAEIEVQLPGPEETEVTTRVVDAGEYSALRVTFNEIDVWIDQGLVIDGVPVTGLIDVEFEDLNLVVERTIDLNLEEGTDAELVVDMNATVWLDAVDPILKIVDETVVAESIQVWVR